jgi:hypothetical protein
VDKQKSTCNLDQTTLPSSHPKKKPQSRKALSPHTRRSTAPNMGKARIKEAQFSQQSPVSLTVPSCLNKYVTQHSNNIRSRLLLDVLKIRRLVPCHRTNLNRSRYLNHYQVPFTLVLSHQTRPS